MGPIAWPMMLLALVLAATGVAGVVSVGRSGLGSISARRGVIGLIAVLATVTGVGLAAYAANLSGNLGR